MPPRLALRNSRPVPPPGEVGARRTARRVLLLVLFQASPALLIGDVVLGGHQLYGAREAHHVHEAPGRVAASKPWEDHVPDADPPGGPVGFSSTAPVIHRANATEGRSTSQRPRAHGLDAVRQHHRSRHMGRHALAVGDACGAAPGQSPGWMFRALLIEPAQSLSPAPEIALEAISRGWPSSRSNLSGSRCPDSFSRRSSILRPWGSTRVS